MRYFLTYRFSLILFIYLFVVPRAQIVFAQWSPNGPVTITGGAQHPGITSDGAGGIIVGWYTGSTIGATRINSAGVVQWSTWVGSGFGQQVPVSIISDGAGGAILTWVGNGIIAQRINASGVLQWAAGGVTICTGSNSSFDPSITGDGAGGAIIAWFDHRNGVGIYAQHLSAAGVAQWAANGIAVRSVTVMETANDYGPQLTGDGSGVEIIIWNDNRNGNADIYAQRINATGIAQWPTEGLAICTLTNGQGQVNVISDDSGAAVVAWVDDRNGNVDIYAQRISGSGQTQWLADGVPVCIWGGNDAVPQAVNDGAGGAIITWMRSNGMYAQKINLQGELQWPAGPVAMTSLSGATVPLVTTDGAGGAILTWMELRDNNYNIYSQRVLASGVVPWTTNGVGVCTTLGSHGYPVILVNGSGGAFVSWNDSPGWGGGIYAQNVNADGTVGPPASPIISCPAGSISITSNLTGATYQWQVNNGSGFVNISDNSNYAGTNLASLQLNNIPSGWYGYIYRCIVNGLYSTNSKLKFSDNWTGSMNINWENAANWNCGTIPDANTDVVINSGTVVVNTNATVRTLTIASGVNFTVAPGVTLTITHQ